MANLPTYITILTLLFLVAFMLSIGMETTHGQILATLRNERRLVWLSLLANFILVPLLGFILSRLFQFSSDVAAGFLLLTVAPGGLFALNFSRVSKGNLVYAIGLVFVLSLLSVIITPALANLLFTPVVTARVPIFKAIGFLLLVVLLPISAGRAIQYWSQPVARVLGKLMGTLSIVLFITVTLLTSKLKSPAIAALGLKGLTAIILLVVACWVIGWLLGGPQLENRKVLAIGTSMRNVAICLPIALSYFPSTNVLVPIVAFSGISITMNMVFGLIMGRLNRSMGA
ncbi:MAG: hypothetical protein JO235_03850 [Chroococcidiopsidaceae cyanobacterium CP_BM_RX_35]|nr:hypothetical protein [Chroococcidiopsidaceae cyanobacterium CP_BM_RX_35]